MDNSNRCKKKKAVKYLLKMKCKCKSKVTKMLLAIDWGIRELLDIRSKSRVVPFTKQAYRLHNLAHYSATFKHTVFFLLTDLTVLLRNHLHHRRTTIHTTRSFYTSILRLPKTYGFNSGRGNNILLRRHLNCIFLYIYTPIYFTLFYTSYVLFICLCKEAISPMAHTCYITSFH